jgi:hypothetical protein
MYGEHFSIGQHLGKPHSTNVVVDGVEVSTFNEADDYATLTCEQSEHEEILDDSYRWMVGGIAKARDSQGRIRDFHLVCVPGPVET